MFENFWGNRHITTALERMIVQDRIAQTMLFAGAEGVGKATLARRFAARLLGHEHLIELDDLSLPANVAALAARERWPPDKRNDDPLLLASYPDFVTFPPDGPLRQISIAQMRMLKERAPYRPIQGRWRIFLVDHLDRANEQAANSLLKTLEEPPDHLVLILTAENAFDLLPTIRSRAVPFHFAALSPLEMREFAAARKLDSAEKRVALADGSPGVAATLDLEAREKRRQSMLVLLQVAAGVAPWDAWIPHSESISRSKAEKLDAYLRVLYSLLRDLLILNQAGAGIRNGDLATELARIAARVDFDWIRAAAAKTDEVLALLRRNIQKAVALDAFIADLQLVLRR